MLHGDNQQTDPDKRKERDERTLNPSSVVPSQIFYSTIIPAFVAVLHSCIFLFFCLIGGNWSLNFAPDGPCLGLLCAHFSAKL